jgi:putative transposase
LVFRSREVVDLVLEHIHESATILEMAIIVYCVMPDHVHLLVEACSEQSDMIRFVHQAKQRSAFAFSQKYKQRLWQPSYYDHVLREEDATLSVARYIIENPVRAGLVKSPLEYPFLGSDRFAVEQILEAACWDPKKGR